MRLLVIGATKGIGKETVVQALAAGHDVRAFSRSATGLPPDTRLERIDGDATRADDLRPALEAVNAVILTVGLGKALHRFFARVTLFSESAGALLPEMAEHGPKRLLAVTGFGAGDSAAAMSGLERIGHRAILGRAYADKDREEEMIRASDLDWTLVRPVILSNSAVTGRYRVLDDPATWRNGVISRADVAHYLVHAAETGANMRQAVVLTR